MICTFRVCMDPSNAPRGLWKSSPMLRMRFLHEKALVRIGTYSSNSLLSQKQAIRLAALALCEGLGADKSGIARPNTDAFDRLLLGLLPITYTKGCDQPTGPGTPGGAHSKPGTPDSMQSPASTADSVDSIGTPKQASKMKRRRAKLAALVWKEYQLVADGVIAGSGTAEMAMHAYLRHLEDHVGSSRFGCAFFSVHDLTNYSDSGSSGSSSSG